MNNLCKNGERYREREIEEEKRAGPAAAMALFMEITDLSTCSV